MMKLALVMLPASSIGRPNDTNSDAAVENRVAKARRQFGQPFAHEPGSTWKPHAVPVLTEWLQKRGGKR